MNPISEFAGISSSAMPTSWTSRMTLLVGRRQDRRAGLHQVAVALDRQQLPADAVARLEHDYLAARLLEPPRRREPRRPGPDDEHLCGIRHVVHHIRHNV